MQGGKAGGVRGSLLECRKAQAVSRRGGARGGPGKLAPSLPPQTPSTSGRRKGAHSL